MKKMWKLAVVALAAVAFVACSSPTSKAEEFAQKIKDAGSDQAKLEQVLKEIEEYEKGLDADEKKEWDEACKKYLDAAGAAMNVANQAMEAYGNF
jgi:hypothetical protein